QRSRAVHSIVSVLDNKVKEKPMLNRINISHVFVFDQKKALDFYVGKLGLEVPNDQDLGFMRWLTVRAPGDPSHEVLLEIPVPPGMEPKSAEQMRELISTG